MTERSGASAFASDVATAIASIVAVAFIVDTWTRGGVISRFRRAAPQDQPQMQSEEDPPPGIWKMLAEANRIVRDAAPTERRGA